MRVAWLGALGPTQLFEGEEAGKSALLKHLAKQGPDFELHRRRLQNEAEIAGSLGPGSLKLIHAIDEPDGFTLAYEWPGGTHLAGIIDELSRRGDALPFEIVVHIARRVAAAAKTAHERTFIRLDGLSADTVLVADDGRVLLATHRLGLGQSRDPGTHGNDVADIGALLYLMMAGEHADRSSWRLEVEGVPASLIHIVEEARDGTTHHAADLERQLRAWQVDNKAGMSDAVLHAFLSGHDLLGRSALRLLPPPAIEELGDGAGPYPEDDTTTVVDQPALVRYRSVEAEIMPPDPIDESTGEWETSDGPSDIVLVRPVLPRTLGSEVRQLFVDPVPSVIWDPPMLPAPRAESPKPRMRPRRRWLWIALLGLLVGVVVGLALMPETVPLHLVGERIPGR